MDTLVNSITRPNPAIVVADYREAKNAISASLVENRVTDNPITFDTLINIHTVFASAYDDTMAAGGGADELRGGGGNDVITGAGGADDMIGGGDGKDTIHSGGGLDIIDGDGGADQIYLDVPGRKFADGGKGNDTFYFSSGTGLEAKGGSGIDRFVFDRTGAGMHIIDFEVTGRRSTCPRSAWPTMRP
jgi:Ca2+-binding RTX toxin-like protein